MRVGNVSCTSCSMYSSGPEVSSCLIGTSAPLSATGQLLSHDFEISLEVFGAYHVPSSGEL